MTRLLINGTIPAIALAIAVVATTLPAQAASFTPFSFKTNVTTSSTVIPDLLNDPTKDIRLDSVQYGGQTVNQFQVLSSGKVIQNDTYTLPSGETYGILNSGRGPNTDTDPLIEEGPSKPNPINLDIAASLGNLNLNSLLVTRESADKAIIEVSFAKPVNTFFFWERGGTPGTSVAGDSDILIDAIAGDGNTILASYKVLRANYTKAGFNISTLVNRPNPQDPPLLNNGPFNIGSIGISLNGISAKTLRLTSEGNNLGPANGDNGPDFKLIAAQVPEPSLLLSTLIAGGLGLVLKRKKSA